MRFVILGMLLGGPLSMYDVRRGFAEVVSLFYSASTGSIQRALAELLAAGLVSAEYDPASARGRRVYRVTGPGREAWRDWMRAPIEGAELERAMLAKVFFIDRLEAADDRVAVLTSLRERVGEEERRLRAVHERFAPRAEDMPVGQLATLDYGLRSLALARKWLDGLDGLDGRSGGGAR